VPHSLEYCSPMKIESRTSTEEGICFEGSLEPSSIGEAFLCS
jgi:hypothetical protein